MLLRKIILIFNINLCLLSGQEIGAEWLLTPTSPTFRGMGEIGVCLPSEDNSSRYFNPANGLYGDHGISPLPELSQSFQSHYNHNVRFTTGKHCQINNLRSYR